MAVDSKRQKLVHLNSAVAKAPTGVLNKGEIAVQYANEDPALYIEKVDGTLAKFVDQDKVESLIGSAISASTDEFVALKTEITQANGELAEQVAELSGSVETLDSEVVKTVVVNGVTGTTANNVAEVTIDTDDVKVGSNISYGEDTTLISTQANVTEALQAIANKVKTNDDDIDALQSASHTHGNAAVLDGITAAKVDGWDNAAAKAHEHANKALLDTYTQTEADLADAVAKKHAHTNADVLDGITAAKVANWDEAYSKEHDHANKALLDTYTQTEANLADAVAKKHEHANAAELDLIQSGDVAKWNSMSSGAAVVVEARTTGVTDSVLKAYDIKQGGELVGTIDIPKDLVVTSGQIVEEAGVKYLRLTIANQSAPVDIAVSDLVDAYTAGNGIEVSTGNVISAKVVAENGLSVDATGIKMGLASATANGAMSSSDFSKLAGIEADADVNVLEGVQVNGADLVIDGNKKVNVTIATGTADGTIKVNGTDVAVAGLGSAAYEDTTAFDAAGAADAVKTELVGDMTGATKTLGALQDAIEGLDLGDHNVIEGVQVNGADLTPDANKKVNVTVAEGTANGTVKVNGTDVAVHGLGSAAYENASAFDEAGAAATAKQEAIDTVVGTSADTSSSNTVAGAKKYADEKVATAVTGATGDTYVSASVSNKEVVVAATQSTKDSLALADTALQGIATGKESGAQVVNKELDFTSFGIDCGTY